MIEGIKKALKCFKASREKKDAQDIKTLAAYIALTAMAVYPNIFDPDQDLVPEFECLTANIKKALADEPKKTPRYLFFRELLVKSNYFLALAMIEIGDIEKADALLKSIASNSETGYYSFWAQKKLAEVGTGGLF